MSAQLVPETGTGFLLTISGTENRHRKPIRLSLAVEDDLREWWECVNNARWTDNSGWWDCTGLPRRAASATLDSQRLRYARLIFVSETWGSAGATAELKILLLPGRNGCWKMTIPVLLVANSGRRRRVAKSRAEIIHDDREGSRWRTEKWSCYQ